MNIICYHSYIKRTNGKYIIEHICINYLWEDIGEAGNPDYLWEREGEVGAWGNGVGRETTCVCPFITF